MIAIFPSDDWMRLVLKSSAAGCGHTDPTVWRLLQSRLEPLQLSQRRYRDDE